MLWTNIRLSCLVTQPIFKATYPLLRCLVLGPILRSLTQRDGDDRERIFKRPPLLWRESRGATGVKTPDNQSGILKFQKLHRLETKPNLSSSEQTKTVWLLKKKKQVCGANELPIFSTTQVTMRRLCHPQDLRLYQKGLTVSGLIRFEAKQQPTDSPADHPRTKCVWGHRGKTEEGGGG